MRVSESVDLAICGSRIATICYFRASTLSISLSLTFSRPRPAFVFPLLKYLSDCSTRDMTSESRKYIYSERLHDYDFVSRCS